MMDKKSIEQIAIDCFLSLSRNPLLYQCEISRKEWLGKMALCIDTPNSELALKIYKDRKLLFENVLELGFADRLLIMVKGRVFRPAFRPKNHNPDSPDSNLQLMLQQDPRILRHANLLKAIGQEAVNVTLHDENEGTGYKCLDLYCTLPERLNKKKEEVIGQPISVVDPRIAEPRIHYLKKALQNAQCETYEYDFEDSHYWKFKVSVTPIYGTEEMIAIVHDAQPWQLGYWLNRRVPPG